MHPNFQYRLKPYREFRQEIKLLSVSGYFLFTTILKYVYFWYLSNTSKEVFNHFKNVVTRCLGFTQFTTGKRDKAPF